MSRIQDKLSSIVPSQLPEFIQSDYQTFIQFLKAYYQFLEQDKHAQEILQNAKSYSDVDRTVDEFITYFKNQFIPLIPDTAVADKKLIIKKARDLYNRKGSIDSYKLFFRILFDLDSDVYFPSEQILKASDGKWKRDVSIFIRTVYGNPDTIVNKAVTVITAAGRFTIFIKRKEPVNEYFADATGQVSENTFEFFIDDSRNNNLSVGDTIEFPGYKGRIVSTTTSLEILTSGEGYRVGDIFDIISGTGRDSILRVSKVSSTGGIEGVQLLKFGIGYQSEFFYYLNTGSRRVAEFGFDGSNVTINDYFTTSDIGTITSPNYAIDAFVSSYSGEVLREFQFATSVVDELSQLTTGRNGAVRIRLGAKARYPGYYTSIDGFLNDAIYIQDRDFYQPFSYVVKIEEQLKNYKTAVLQLLHPTGTKLFGEYVVINRQDILTAVISTVRYLTQNYLDSFAVTDTLSLLSFNRVRELEQEAIALEDSLEFSSINNKTDQFSLADAGEIIINDYDEEVYFSEFYAGSLVATF